MQTHKQHSENDTDGVPMCRISHIRSCDISLAYCPYMCMYMYICIYVHKQLYKYIYIYIYTHIHIYTYIYIYTYIWICGFTCIGMCIYIYIYMCILMCMYKYVYTSRAPLEHIPPVALLVLLLREMGQRCLVEPRYRCL